MGTKHQPLAFVSVSDLIRDKSINAGTEHQACHHPFVISTSFMTPDHEENVKEDHDDFDTIDECYEYTKNMTRGARREVPNDPNKLLADGTIKKVSLETIKNSVSPTATSQEAGGEFLENCSLVMRHQRPGRDTELTPGPTSKVSGDPTSEAIRGFCFPLPCKLFSTKVHCFVIFANEVRNNSHEDNVCLLRLSSQPWK